MDYRAETVNLIKSYYKYKNTSDIKSFIKDACLFFDAVKDKVLHPNELKFLFFIASEIGIPQYYDLLNAKFQNNDLKIEYINLSTLGAMISNTSLYVDDDISLHRYQKEVLNQFTLSKQNRYLLSAPTSFGKTFLVYQIIEKMNYQNIIMVFPTISLLSENYEKLLIMSEESEFWGEFSLHTLSDDRERTDKNIWIYTPERLLAHIDSVEQIKFDFAFIDEIYKIDNQYIIDKETTGENERDTAYRIALEYVCRFSEDILLAGPYMEITKNEANNSLENFTNDRTFKVLNYNEYEIVYKEVIEIKGRASYMIDNIMVEVDRRNIYTKVSSIINAITTPKDNTILYYCTKSGTEKYAKEIMPYINVIPFDESIDGSTYNMFINHVESKFGVEWIVVEALKHRIGIHHGLVPKYIQKQIIRLFNEGILSLLISTTTITEGVNTTAKNIIVRSDKKGIKALKHFDAMNIAGRAGRFYHHFIGRVIVIDNNFNEIYKSKEDILKHKNFDNDTPKNDVDYLITDDKYLKDDEKADKVNLYAEVDKRNIPYNIVEQFKVVSIRDKLIVYDTINNFKGNEHIKISTMIQSIAAYTQITWEGFQLILDVITPIVKDSKLKSLIDVHCKDKQGEPNEYSILTAKTYYYLKGGYFEMLDFTLKRLDRNKAIRETSDMVYNVFKYQLVKYLGVFDLMYKLVISQRLNKNYDEVTGISKLVKKLEYTVLSENARILSDYGVPYSLIEYYESVDSNKRKQFDEYEKYVDSEITSLLK